MTKFKLDPALHILPVELRLRKDKLLVFNIYRSDRIGIEIFFDTLSDAMHFYEVDYNNIIIIGDFNIKFNCNNAQANRMIHVLSEFDLQQQITQPDCSFQQCLQSLL